MRTCLSSKNKADEKLFFGNHTGTGGQVHCPNIRMPGVHKFEL